MTNNEKIILSIIGLVTISGLGYLYFKPSARIVRNAKKYVGEEETAENSGFKNPKFQEKMESAGFENGYQWCNIFAKYVWLDSLSGKKKEVAEKLLTPSTQLTFANFKNDTSGYFEVSQEPKKGSLVIWQSKTTPSKGHIGIVTNPAKKFFETIEGNSNYTTTKGQLRDFKKQARQGENISSSNIKSDESSGAVAYHIRQYDGDGMKLLGFINLK
jgi:hypothetical protein